MRRTALCLVLIGGTALAGCSSTPSLPPADQETYPEPRQARDWEEWGENRPDQPPTRGAQGTGGANGQRVQVIGTLLSSADIRRALSGQTLRGCYPNGQTFAERLASDGRFYDAASNRELGTWYVDDEALCFRYPERAEAGEPDQCFAVSREGSDLFFYARDFSAIVAATRCAS